nr:alpha amylase C-terminal domain-containing protein [Nanchangia anserum]
MPHEGYRLGLPEGGDWEEVLNTDAEEFGGSGVVNSRFGSRRRGPVDGHAVFRRAARSPLGACGCGRRRTSRSDTSRGRASGDHSGTRSR